MNPTTNELVRITTRPGEQRASKKETRWLLPAPSGLIVTGVHDESLQIRLSREALTLRFLRTEAAMSALSRRGVGERDPIHKGLAAVVRIRQALTVVDLRSSIMVRVERASKLRPSSWGKTDPYLCVFLTACLDEHHRRMLEKEITTHVGATTSIETPSRLDARIAWTILI